jgi:5-methylthioribose kinase
MNLDKNNLSEITTYLQTHRLVKDHEFVSKAEKPGEGNMNCTLRLFVDHQTLIIKQARPYVEKYPSIAAPLERILVEKEFYKIISKNDFMSLHMPKILFSDAENHIIVMQDLGDSKDFSSLYTKGNILNQEDSKMCAIFLNELHSQFKKSEQNELMANKNLKTLNHEHIFVYPFLEENGFNLDTITIGLQSIAMNYKTNEQLKKVARDLGEVYLANGDILLHGDYYPGSWLNTKNGLMVIDPEFAFYGKAEFDLGVLYAHLYMAQQHDNVLKEIEVYYKKSIDFNENLFKQFIGIEMMRRIIGLAQLPLDLTLLEKEELLIKAHSLLMN